MSGPILQLTDVAVSFERWGQHVLAVDRLSLEIATGTWVALVGHNGSGKSTLLRIMSGTQPVDSGEALFTGKDVAQMRDSDRACRMFMVHQNPLKGTAPLLTVAENLRVAVSGRYDADLALLVLEQIGLAGRINQPVQLLSGGERQLLALAIARARAPELLLLDEPFSALDPIKEAQSLALLDAMRIEGTTIIHITHQLERVERYASRVVSLDHGRLVEDRAASRVLEAQS